MGNFIVKHRDKPRPELVCPFKFCPQCGGEVEDNACSDCGKSSVKMVKPYINFYDNMNIGDYTFVG